MADRAKAPWFKGDLVLVPGAQKAASTTLHAALTQHPACRALRVKEPHYLGLVAEDFQAHAGWYRSLFTSDDAIHVDASTSYLYHPKAAARACAIDPHVRSIIIIRDPARRAYSAYMHCVRRVVHPERRPFSAVLSDIEARLGAATSVWDAEDASLDAAIQRGDVEPSALGEGFVARSVGGPSPARFEDPHWGHRYLGASEYSRYVPAWESELPGRVLIVCMEELVRDPRATLGRVSDFLGIDPRAWPRSELPHENQARVPRGTAGRVAFHLANDTRAGRWLKQVIRRAGLEVVIDRIRASAQEPAACDPAAYAHARRLLSAEYAYWQQRLPRVAAYWDRSPSHTRTARS